MTNIDQPPRRAIIITAALDYMEHHGWYCAEEDDDPKVVAHLETLFDSTPNIQPTPCSGSLLFDTGVTLALMWEAELRADYERSIPLWVCDCGARYKREHWSRDRELIYTVADDGVFDELVGSTTGKRGIGPAPRDEKYPDNNGGCPKCRRAFKVTLARQADPQTSLLFDHA